MPKRTSSYNSWQLGKLTNSETAAAYLSAAISDSPEMFRKALRNVAQARQMAKVARGAGVTRESLYRATSEIGNPTLETLDSVLEVLDLELAVVAKKGKQTAVTPTSSVLSSPVKVRQGYKYKTKDVSVIKSGIAGVLAPLNAGTPRNVISIPAAKLPTDYHNWNVVRPGSESPTFKIQTEQGQGSSYFDVLSILSAQTARESESQQIAELTS